MRRERRGSIFGPVLLVCIGLILLLNTLGLVDWGIWSSLIKLWPILIIAAGLDILFGRRSAIGSLIVTLLVVALILGGMWLVVGQFQANNTVVHTLSPPLLDASSAEIGIAVGAGTLNLDGLSDNDLLLEGEVRLQAGQELNEQYELSDTVAQYKISSEATTIFFPTGGFNDLEKWALYLNPDIPTALTISTGIGQSVLTLTQMNLTDLQLKVGIGDVTVWLPEQGQFRATVNGGIGNITIRIPADSGIMLTITGGLNKSEIPDDYVQDGDVYTSPNYATAGAQINMNINGGLGKINLKPDRDN